LAKLIYFKNGGYKAITKGGSNTSNNILNFKMCQKFYTGMHGCLRCTGFTCIFTGNWFCIILGVTGPS